ncbi:MAG: TonB family protein [Bacteroidetes bacterium]|nr:TonB family protein [Bacteroidota bacterium]
MDTNHTSSESFNDIIFENRNKEYGAYAIRRSYNDNLSKALLSSASLFGIIVFSAFLFTKNNDNEPDMQGQLPLQDSISVFVDVTPIEKPEVKIKKIVVPKEFVPKSDNLNLVASNDKKDVLEKGNEEIVIVKGGKSDGLDSIPAEIGVKVETSTPTLPVAPTAFADQMPEFSGNLFKYLRENLKYPREAVENYTSGTVVLQFVVEKDGSIDNIKILNPVPNGCTEEAMRVVKSMPKWIPGKNHGEPVRVLFNLPVKFTIK